MAAFRANGELELAGGKKYFPNEYCTLTDETNPKRTALTKVDATGTKLVPIIDCREGVWGIKPRNREQHFAFDALLDDRVKLVTLMGKAGTGKTLLAMAAGFEAHRATTANSAGWWSRVRPFPWARNSVFCPGRSRKNSRRGCSRFTTRWKC